MSKIIVDRLYAEDESRIVIDRDQLEKGYFFGESQSFLVDKKIDVQHYLKRMNQEEDDFGCDVSIEEPTEYFDEEKINYYRLYTDASDCEFNNWCPYVNEEKIEELEKEYPYYFNLDGSISDIKVCENKCVLNSFEEYTYFTYHNANCNLKTVEIEEEYEELELMESNIKRGGTYQLDLYKNKNGEYVVVYNDYYAGSLDVVKDYDISIKQLEEKYDYCIEE